MQYFFLGGGAGESRAPADSDGVVQAACELGDVLAEYVSTVPSQPDWGLP